MQGALLLQVDLPICVEKKTLVVGTTIHLTHADRARRRIRLRDKWIRVRRSVDPGMRRLCAGSAQAQAPVRSPAEDDG